MNIEEEFLVKISDADIDGQTTINALKALVEGNSIQQ
jgi:acyl carrier protein